MLRSIAVTLAWGDRLEWNKFASHMKRKGAKWLQICRGEGQSHVEQLGDSTFFFQVQPDGWEKCICGLTSVNSQFQFLLKFVKNPKRVSVIESAEGSSHSEVCLTKTPPKILIYHGVYGSNALIASPHTQNTLCTIIDQLLYSRMKCWQKWKGKKRLWTCGEIPAMALILYS